MMDNMMMEITNALGTPVRKEFLFNKTYLCKSNLKTL